MSNIIANVNGPNEIRLDRQRAWRISLVKEPKNLTMDFTKSSGMANTHRIWSKDTNNVVKDFFARALNRSKAEETPGLIYDQNENAFRIIYLE